MFRLSHAFPLMNGLPTELVSVVIVPIVLAKETSDNNVL